MEQARALNALEPYLALCKAANSPRAAADLITQATSNPNTYVFAELLSRPQIQDLRQASDFAPHLTLLEIFSYGTYETYVNTATAAGLPPLNDAQVQKLRQLSLLTLARDPAKNLRYDALRSSLGLPHDDNSNRALEDLVISAIYAGLVEAQLDPRNQIVHISSVSPLRDLAPGSVPGMLGSLREWSGRCTSTLADLEGQIAAIRASAAQRATDKKVWDATVEKLVAEEEGLSKGSDKSGSGAHGRGQSGLVSRAVNSYRSQQRFGKRGSVEANVDDDDDDDANFEGAMDVDEDGGDADDNGKKRSSRRKL